MGTGVVNGKKEGLDCLSEGIAVRTVPDTLSYIVLSTALALLILVLELMTPWIFLLQDAGAVYPWGMGLSGAQSEDGTPSVHSSARDRSEYH